ncbi:MAG: hypothetical protein IJ767_00760 [Bacteroidaceae bacterium]|nr:hypothetical protein [Bacteroidaceae bacterium]
MNSLRAYKVFLCLLLLMLPCTLVQASMLRPDTLAVPCDTVVAAADTASADSSLRRRVKGRVDHLREEYNIDSIHSIRDVDSILAVRYQRTGTYDTLYLTRPTQRFTARLRITYGLRF